MNVTSPSRNVAKSRPPVPAFEVPSGLKLSWPVRFASLGTRRFMAYRMSAPNLYWWLPTTFVQLLTNWNCCSLSVSGQLQRATFKPSPKFEVMLPPPLFAAAVIKKAARPEVAVFPRFMFGMPNVFIGLVPSSGLCVWGLYLK